ncbi:MAG: hypothetical protein DMG39_07595 [Acidobacteria bacterium]|nr:MAG: hypothetical protein DMG39_07595 [Acidobacteriota bacterium]
MKRKRTKKKVEPEKQRSEHEPDPKDYGQPEGNYTTNRAAYDVWLESEDRERSSEAFRQWNDERSKAILAVVFKPASDRLQSRYERLAQTEVAAA